MNLLVLVLVAILSMSYQTVGAVEDITSKGVNSKDSEMVSKTPDSKDSNEQSKTSNSKDSEMASKTPDSKDSNEQSKTPNSKDSAGTSKNDTSGAK